MMASWKGRDILSIRDFSRGDMEVVLKHARKMAPFAEGQKSSQTETSKEKGVLCSTASRGVRLYWRCIQRSRLQMARWVLGAPLGRPVDPEV